MCLIDSPDQVGETEVGEAKQAAASREMNTIGFGSPHYYVTRGAVL
jgi:hypothetical protein